MSYTFYNTTVVLPLHRKGLASYAIKDSTLILMAAYSYYHKYGVLHR